MRFVLLALLLSACGGATTITPDLSTPPDMAMQFVEAAPTYTNFAQFFFATYCTSCHPSASSTRDFTMYSVIQQNSHDIACGVSPTPLSGCSGTPAPGQFPIGSGPLPSDDERNKLVAWIMAGLPM
jgi:hypothetical protein